MDDEELYGNLRTKRRLLAGFKVARIAAMWGVPLSAAKLATAWALDAKIREFLDKRLPNPHGMPDEVLDMLERATDLHRQTEELTKGWRQD